MRESDENIVNQAMETLIDMMAFETRKTIVNFEEAKNQKVERILLVGGLVNMPNFLPYLAKKMSRDILPGNPFARIVYPAGLEPNIPELSNTFAIAAGLAMRDI